MLISFLKIAFRNLSKRRGYSVLNISGLAIGIACCLLIFEYVAYERSFDTFHEKADRIVRMQDEEYQTKEIGIRKVLGASVQTLLYILSRDFLLLVVLAFVIAIPLSFLAMQHWLESFAYRISIG